MNNLSLPQIASSSPVENRPQIEGRVIGIRGHIVKASVPAASLGDICGITLRSGKTLRAEIVSFDGHSCCLAPIGNARGITPGDLVIRLGSECYTDIPENPVGCVLNADGSILNKKIRGKTIQIPLFAAPPSPLDRTRINTQFTSGITAIDGLLTLGMGQRVGLFASAGLGKSTLMGMMTRNAQYDVCVIALIGERGREVQEFVYDVLGEKGMQKAVVIAATSDESAMRRRLAGYLATAIAEHFRNQGLNVLLLFDSLTRFARAVRDVGLAAGDLPVRQGYTASVYSELPHIIERAGTDSKGSVTAVYTVLTSTDMEADPLADELKSLLDGHIHLSPDLAARGIRPAIDIVRSLSRLNDRFHEPTYLKAQSEVRTLLARAGKDKDLLLFGGTPDDELARALELESRIFNTLYQLPHESRTAYESKSLITESIRN